MMPCKLSLTAFGPYAKGAEIDFEQFQRDRFFLIHGPTGSGKTSILDAISFALYGDSSGGLRRAPQMRSDHASPDIRTEVSLEFLLGETRYRVTRHPEWERPRKRGEGKVREEGQATLYRVNEGNEEALVSGAQKVTQKIEELLGFESDQFRQVCLLPQNQFGKFLLAGSREREALLEILFRTERFRRVQEALDSSAKAIEREARDRTLKRQGCLEGMGVKSREELEARLVGARLLQTEIAAVVEAATRARDNHRARLEEARRVEALFREEEVSRQELERWSLELPELEKKRARLEAARRTAPLSEYEQIARELERETARRLEERSQKKKEAENDEKAKSEAARVLAIEEARAPERLRLEIEWERLKASEALLGLWRTEADALLATEAAAREQREARARVEKSGAEAQAHLDKLRGELPLVTARAGRLEPLRQQLTACDEGTKRMARLEVLRKEYATVRRQTEAARVEFASLEAEQAESRRQFAELEKGWLEGQAAWLASGLKDGESCPVCGSNEHPKPARQGTERAPSKEDWLSARKKVEDLEKKWRTKAQERELGERKLAVLETEARALKEASLGALPCEGVEAVRAQLKEACDAAARLPAMEQGIREGEERLQERQRALLAEKEKEEAREKELAARQAKVAELRGQLSFVPNPDPRAFTSHTRELEARRATANAALESARANRERAEQAAALSAQAAATADAAALDCEQRLARSRETLDAAARRAGFETLEAFHAAALSEAETAKLSEVVEAQEEARVRLTDRAKRAQAPLVGLARPELPGLENELAVAERELTTQLEGKGALEKEIAQWEKGRLEIDALSSELEKVEDRYRTLGRLAEVARGENPARINFQRYVLAAFLEEVLEMASERLRVMSKGRFLLRRSAGVRDARLSGGLDLEVDDSFTGSLRPVTTLSGGEGFLASLALALGLSDVVQAHAGGVRLDAIFVDEGFGTLDPESLDLALRTLMDLQRGGRLVGIISHVPELKQLIPSRIEITPDRAGSHARVVI